MFAGIVEAPFDVSKADEAMDLYMKVVVPTIKAQLGGLGGYIMVNRDSGVAISVAFYQTRKQALAFWESDEYGKTIAQFAKYFKGPPTRREIFEVYGEM